MQDRFALVVQNKTLLVRIGKIADKLGAEVDVFGSPAEVRLEEPPTVIVVEVEFEGAADAIAEWKSRWPDCLLAGAISIPKPELWHGALAAGCHFVANRGAFPNKLREWLEARSETGGGALVPGRRIPARMNGTVDDGQAGADPDAPDGELAIYRVEGVLYAVRDICPHAGELLSNGCLEAGVITCPLHGSQFDVRTGERLRGPADAPIRTYRVLTEGDEILVEV